MAAPVYETDLVDIDSGLAESTTGYVAYGGGGAGLGAGPDFSMQGVNCVDKQITAAEKGILFNNGAGLTIPAGDHVFVWHFTATPGVTDTLVNRGVVGCVGSSASAFCKYHLDGKDTFGAGGRVGKCYPIDPSVYTSNTGASPYRTLVGSPSGVFQYFGSGLNTTAAVKAANMGLDATRYGKGGFITAGDVATPATFPGFAAENDRNDAAPNNNRWGILTSLGGNNYELQGMFAVGQNTAGTPTQVYFKDANQNINIADTVHSASDFTQFVLDHASSECHWENINITALGTNNKGLIDDIAGKRVLNKGSLTDFGTTKFFDSASSATGHVWRSSDTVTSNGAAITGGSIETATGATTALVEQNIDGIETHFIGANDIHAIEMPTLIAANTAVTWKSTFDTTTYATVNGSTGTETLKCNVDTGFTLTITVAAGATEPTYNNIGGGSVVIVTVSVDLTLTVKDKKTLALIQNVQTSIYLKESPFTELMNEDTTALGVATQTYSGTVPVEIVWKCRKSEATDDPRYIAKSGVDTIGVDGLNLTILLNQNTILT